MTNRPSYRLPAEWEPQAGVLIAWPHADTDWADRLSEVETTYVALAAAVTRFEPLHIIVADAALRERARLAIEQAGADQSRAHFIEPPFGGPWVAGLGPVPPPRPEGVLLNDYRFTGW